jgi:hypothetical protein
MYNLYISAASFFTWASQEFNLIDHMKSSWWSRVSEETPVEPFKKDEVQLLIKAGDFCEEVVIDRRRKFVI